ITAQYLDIIASRGCAFRRHQAVNKRLAGGYHIGKAFRQPGTSSVGRIQYHYWYCLETYPQFFSQIAFIGRDFDPYRLQVRAHYSISFRDLYPIYKYPGLNSISAFKIFADYIDVIAAG